LIQSQREPLEIYRTDLRTPAPFLQPDGVFLTRRPTQHNHVTFIKTHKCASSTIQNILIRYGLRHNLTFTLPRSDGHFIGWPLPFSRSQIRPSKQPDIHCYHSVLSNELLLTMPPDAFNMAAVRDPFTQIKSSYVYYGWNRCTRGNTLTQVLEESMNNPSQYKVCGLPVYNPVMYDMGMSFNAMSNKTKVTEYIEMLDRKFHLMIVVEYFYESIIIMRDMLGWTTEDVVFFLVNFHKDGGDDNSKIGADLPDTPEWREIVYNYLSADKVLYDHFKGKLEAIIAANRDYLAKEVTALKQMQDWLMNFCIKSSMISTKIADKRFAAFGNGAYGYILTQDGLKNETCMQMASAERILAAILSDRQPPLV